MDLDLWKRQMMVAIQAASIVQSYHNHGIKQPDEREMAYYIERAAQISDLWLKTLNNLESLVG